MVKLVYDFDRQLMDKHGVTVDDLLSDLRQYACDNGSITEIVEGCFEMDGRDEMCLPAFARKQMHRHPETLSYIKSVNLFVDGKYDADCKKTVTEFKVSGL